MTPALETVLSPLYSGALAPVHRADFAKSGLTDATIRQHKIMSVPPAMIDRLGVSDPAGGVRVCDPVPRFPRWMDGSHQDAALPAVHRSERPDREVPRAERRPTAPLLPDPDAAHRSRGPGARLVRGGR
jgi:hypothetical protein